MLLKYYYHEVHLSEADLNLLQSNKNEKTPTILILMNTNIGKSTRHTFPSTSIPHVDLIMFVDTPHLRSNRDVDQFTTDMCPAFTCPK